MLGGVDVNWTWAQVKWFMGCNKVIDNDGELELFKEIPCQQPPAYAGAVIDWDICPDGCLEVSE